MRLQVFFSLFIALVASGAEYSSSAQAAASKVFVAVEASRHSVDACLAGVDDPQVQRFGRFLGTFWILNNETLFLAAQRVVRDSAVSLGQTSSREAGAIGSQLDVSLSGLTKEAKKARCIELLSTMQQNKVTIESLIGADEVKILGDIYRADHDLVIAKRNDSYTSGCMKANYNKQNYNFPQVRDTCGCMTRSLLHVATDEEIDTITRLVDEDTNKAAIYTQSRPWYTSLVQQYRAACMKPTELHEFEFETRGRS